MCLPTMLSFPNASSSTARKPFLCYGKGLIQASVKGPHLRFLIVNSATLYMASNLVRSSDIALLRFLLSNLVFDDGTYGVFLTNVSSFKFVIVKCKLSNSVP